MLGKLPFGLQLPFFTLIFLLVESPGNLFGHVNGLLCVGSTQTRTVVVLGLQYGGAGELGSKVEQRGIHDVFSSLLALGESVASVQGVKVCAGQEVAGLGGGRIFTHL